MTIQTHIYELRSLSGYFHDTVRLDSPPEFLTDTFARVEADLKALAAWGIQTQWDIACLNLCINLRDGLPPQEAVSHFAAELGFDEGILYLTSDDAPVPVREVFTRGTSIFTQNTDPTYFPEAPRSYGVIPSMTLRLVWAIPLAASDHVAAVLYLTGRLKLFDFQHVNIDTIARALHYLKS